MKISVVIPAYNEEKYLLKTLTSLERLDRKADEVIVVDGGSTDHTVLIAKKWGARVVAAGHHTIAYSRQKGLLVAKGEVVACTDADDIIPPSWLTIIEKELAKSGVVAVYGNYAVYDGPWLYRTYINTCNAVVLFLASTFGIHLAAGQNMAFWKQKALEVGGFPVHFRNAEDMEMIRRLQQVGSVVYLLHNTVATSGRRGKEGIGLIFRIFRELFQYFTTGETHTVDFPNIR